jgi:dTDP-4-dehydrorhamnose 3,5-epimerase
MEISETKIKGVLLFKPQIVEDFRGCYLETYNERIYSEEIKKRLGEDIKFVADDYSVSSKDVLRGIHGDNKTWKLIDCMRGRIYVVIVNCDAESSDFGKWESFILSEENKHQLLVPAKFGTSHLVLSDKAIFHYKQSAYYDPAVLKQFTYRFDDPRFNIFWPCHKPLLSQRDKLEIK